jgi:hypothetical protein
MRGMGLDNRRLGREDCRRIKGDWKEIGDVKDVE